MVTFQAGLAFVIACNLLLCLWLLYRARPGSGDAMVLPTVALLSGSMLVGILPRLLWPEARGLQLAGLIVSIIVPTVLLIIQIRRGGAFAGMRALCEAIQSDFLGKPNPIPVLSRPNQSARDWCPNPTAWRH